MLKEPRTNWPFGMTRLSSTFTSWKLKVLFRTARAAVTVSPAVVWSGSTALLDVRDAETVRSWFWLPVALVARAVEGPATVHTTTIKPAGRSFMVVNLVLIRHLLICGRWS